MPIDLRTIAADEHEAFNRACNVGFGEPPAPTTLRDSQRAVFEADRALVAVDGDDIVGTTAAWTFAMTVPGGASLPVAGVTMVTVAPTHRRQGILRRLMARQLDDVAALGEPMAVLNASESSIYGRFGYGIAQHFLMSTIDTIRADFARPPSGAGAEARLRLVDQADAAPMVGPIHDAVRAATAGEVSRHERWWANLLDTTEEWAGGGPQFVVVAEGATPARSGYAIYTVDRSHSPGWTLVVRELAAADDEVAARLWRYLLDVDLVDTVTVNARPLDDPLRWRLVDPRQVRTTGLFDYLQVRLLDVPLALAARRYPLAGDVVLEVVDPFRPASGGRFHLEAGPDGARCEPTTAPADLELDVADLGAIYLGGVTLDELARAGRISERRSGAVASTSALFGWPRAPFCSTRF